MAAVQLDARDARRDAAGREEGEAAGADREQVRQVQTCLCCWRRNPGMLYEMLCECLHAPCLQAPCLCAPRPTSPGLTERQCAQVDGCVQARGVDDLQPEQGRGASTIMDQVSKRAARLKLVPARRLNFSLACRAWQQQPGL